MIHGTHGHTIIKGYTHGVFNTVVCDIVCILCVLTTVVELILNTLFTIEFL